MMEHESPLSSTSDEPQVPRKFERDDIQTRDLMWSAPIHHGDCKLSGLIFGTLDNGPTFRFRSDGTCELLARFYSSDSDDAWVIHNLYLKDVNGTVLFTMPKFSSPGTVTPNQVIDWVRPLLYPAIYFPWITQVTITSSC
ncbi:hypothetical protein IU447_01330 [Nocardia farcinica]|uniref:DUF6294 domain-containing protein n=1 Tax=Nocardia farcinica TaxID=37329 RepID=A0A449GE37_NOCFR|nr:DUF6294 family protein [Nocardia farcinica]MBF6358740.1 hypothetical protein [Nocardia farcinica]VFA90888.1 Uncharacterised protein [Nocardia farcinica]